MNTWYVKKIADTQKMSYDDEEIVQGEKMLNTLDIMCSICKERIESINERGGYGSVVNGKSGERTWFHVNCFDEATNNQFKLREP